MSTYGSNTTAVFGNNVTITAGSNTYALGTDVRVEGGNDMIRQIVIGSDATPMGTGAYTGTITIGTLYATDGDFISLTAPAANGQIPESTITLTLKDTGSPTTKTLTIKAYLNKLTWEQRENAFVRHGVRGEITNNTSRLAIA